MQARPTATAGAAASLPAEPARTDGRVPVPGEDGQRAHEEGDTPARNGAREAARAHRLDAGSAERSSSTSAGPDTRAAGDEAAAGGREPGVEAAQGAPRNARSVRDALADLRHHDSVLWRRAIDAGVMHGPDAFVRYSPPVIGLAFAMMLPRHRHAVRDTLRMIFGKRGRLVEAADVATVFANFASCLTEAFIAGSDRGDRLRGVVVNDHHYVQAFEHGSGVIAATAHTGGWQAAGSLMQSVHDEDTLVVMQRERDERAQALSDAVRDRAGVRVAHIGDSPFDALPLLAHLRRRGVVAVQIDRLPRGMRGREVRMFGHPWLVPEGPFLLAALSGAPIVPVFTRRLRYMEYEVFIAPPIRLPRKPSPDELDAAAQQAITEMERYVRAHPTQWFHFESDSPKSAVTASKRVAQPGARRGPGDGEPRASESGAVAPTGENGG